VGILSPRLPTSTITAASRKNHLTLHAYPNPRSMSTVHRQEPPQKLQTTDKDRSLDFVHSLEKTHAIAGIHALPMYMYVAARDRKNKRSAYIHHANQCLIALMPGTSRCSVFDKLSETRIVLRILQCGLEVLDIQSAAQSQHGTLRNAPCCEDATLALLAD